MFDEQLKDAEDLGAGGGGNFFKFKQGKNKIRILHEGKMITSHFVGGRGYTCFGETKGCPFHGDNAPTDDEGKPRKPSAKLVTYILDRSDAEAKPQIAEIAYSVVQALKTISENEGYEFDSFPMPYDITVTFDKNSASPADKYKTIPFPKRENVSEDVLVELEKALEKESPADVVEKKKERAKQKAEG